MKPYEAEREYFFAEGCFITELSNDEEDPEVSIARCRVEPGRTTRWHYLEGIVERYVMLEGSGYVEVESMAGQQLGPGDVVVIPAGSKQRIQNNGSDALIFLAVCTPRFVTSAYVDVEDESAL